MGQTFTPDRATSEYRRQSEAKAAPRPDRFALWAVAMAVIAMFAGLLTADASASSGSVATTSTSDSTARYSRAWYDQIWDNTGTRNKRWARRTSWCESNHDPNAYNPAGPYLGAFQFLKSTWRSARKSPGGDPRNYNWRTQAVVAIAHKRYARKQGWPNPWPVCG